MCSLSEFLLHFQDHAVYIWWPQKYLPEFWTFFPFSFCCGSFLFATSCRISPFAVATNAGLQWLWGRLKWLFCGSHSMSLGRLTYITFCAQLIWDRATPTTVAPPPQCRCMFGLWGRHSRRMPICCRHSVLVHAAIMTKLTLLLQDRSRWPTVSTTC